MAKYGINPNVLDTYVADFHGKTVTLFQEMAPDQETNKPVCIDCHGVHDMLNHDDEGSHVKKENLLATCRKCHPDSLVSYTCYTCHEHQPDRIEREHREEGISNFQDCTRCHPTGREEEGGDRDGDDD